MSDKNGDKSKKIKISVETVPNGYLLRVEDRHYLYFSIQELLAGFIYHVGLGEPNYSNKDFMAAIVDAAADWKSSGDFVKKESEKVILANAKLSESRHEQRLLQIENRNLKKMLYKKNIKFDD